MDRAALPVERTPEALNTEISLDIAVARLEPAIAAGLRIEEIGPVPPNGKP